MFSAKDRVLTPLGERAIVTIFNTGTGRYELEYEGAIRPDHRFLSLPGSMLRKAPDLRRDQARPRR